jgi:hypothetical protein
MYGHFKTANSNAASKLWSFQTRSGVRLSLNT